MLISRVPNMKTSDNVSCVKTIYDKDAKKNLTVFGTYDGKINFIEL
jgi:hypothetical protein